MHKHTTQVKGGGRGGNVGEEKEFWSGIHLGTLFSWRKFQRKSLSSSSPGGLSNQPPH